MKKNNEMLDPSVDLGGLFNAVLNTTYSQCEEDGSYYVNVDGDTATIYFEWSNSKRDWKNNFDFPAKPYRKMGDLWFCHRGFLKVWKAIEPHIKDDILNPAVKKINIAGYSHGAAIAQLCYEYVKFNRPDVEVTGYGFGAPRVFWGFAKKRVKERFKGFVVIRNGWDIVTHVPPVVFGFHHICYVHKVGKHKTLVDDHRSENYLEGLSEKNE